MNYTLLEVLPDGTERRDYNGIIRNQYGHIIEADPINGITPQNTAAMRTLRKQKMLSAIENGLMRVTDAPNPAEAVAYIVAKRAEIAMSDDGRAGNDAAKIVLAAVDALPDRRQETERTIRHEYTVDADTVRVVEAMMRARRDGTEVATEIYSDNE